MNYKDIEVFLELVRCRNITKAAENLYLSQSAVSNRLKSLEDELGVQLFLRAKGHRIVELTRQGGEFIPVAERWKALYEETELIRSSALSVVRIATNESTFDRIVTPMLQGYIRRNPDKKVCVKICDSRETYDLVSKDLVDFGFAAYSSNLGGVVARCIDSHCALYAPSARAIRPFPSTRASWIRRWRCSPSAATSTASPAGARSGSVRATAHISR